LFFTHTFTIAKDFSLLRLGVIGGAKLRSADIWGKSDPYVEGLFSQMFDEGFLIFFHQWN
jgi:hypothetical protein